MRVVIAGHQTWGVQCLDALVSSEHDILAVITYPSAFDSQSGPYERVWYESVSRRARDLGLPLYQPEDVNDDSTLAVVDRLAPDIIVNVAYGHIYRRRLLARPPLGIINIHGALLPHYRGVTPIASALMDGASETGVSVHFVGPEVDCGDLILQKKVGIEPGDHADDIFEKTWTLYPTAILEALTHIASHSVVRIPQDPILGSYYPRRSRRQELIDWNSSAEDAFNFIRALSSPFRGAYTYFHGKQVIVWRASCPNVSRHRGICGQIVAVTDAGTGVKTADSVVMMTQVQLEGDVRRDAREVFSRRDLGCQLGL
jgi:methionyl-tRNA formyltransferase